MIIDPVYFLFIAPGFIIGLIAQFYLKYAYGQYSKIATGTGATGAHAAQVINEQEQLNVRLEVIKGKLSDHFDPTKDIVRLSAEGVNSDSVASVAVVAHEFGHVQQKRKGLLLFKLRTLIVPLVQFGSGFGSILIFIGLFLAITELANIGILLFATTTLFSLITMPIEIDASRRGLAFIKKYNLVDPSKIGGAKTVLTAAAMTYFAALVQSLGQLAYFIMLANGRRD